MAAQDVWNASKQERQIGHNSLLVHMRNYIIQPFQVVYSVF